MAPLTKPAKYDIKDSNIALLGSDLEKRVREHAGDSEPAWQEAGLRPGLQVWRCENFKIVPWPEDRMGTFCDGDSYVVLHTYKKDPDSERLSYDLHFWLGKRTTQDEAGTAAYKTVELDDHLHGTPVQYREVEGSESARFLSHFPTFVCLYGGVTSGFRHVFASPSPDFIVWRLYRVAFSGDRHQGIAVYEVPAIGSSLVEGDVFILDKGKEVWQFNSRDSSGAERFRAGAYVQAMLQQRKGHCRLTVCDEGGDGAGIFLLELGLTVLPPKPASDPRSDNPLLFRLSDSTGGPTFEPVTPAATSSNHVYILDATSAVKPAIYTWIGKNTTQQERRLAIQRAQTYLHKQQAEGINVKLSVTIVKVMEGEETDGFKQAIRRIQWGM